MASAQENILEHMKCGFTITPAIAAQDYNCYHLAAVIKKISDKGITIYRRVIPGTKSKEYSLIPFEER